MLLRIDSDRVIFSVRMYRDRPGVRVLDRHGRETHFDLGGRFANFRLAPDGTLLLRHDTGVAIVDPASHFAMRELIETELAHHDASWSVSFFDALVDTQKGYFARFKLDDVALSHDPETGPTNAVLMPDRQRVVVTIHKTAHVAIFDPVARTTELLPLLVGQGGASEAVVVGSDFWFICYDRFCCLDLKTGAFRASEVLQPQFYDAEHRLNTSGFVGVPRFSKSLSNWLLPRPFSGDILIVSGESLTPVSRIATGGRPYDAVEFEGGSLLILDYPFDVVRAAHVSDAVSI
ncbi:hypothetical protein ACN2C7_02770 [Caulobacter sp. ErkDOM-E]|uniref:hypothetical protein n=1 Tax=Caulobacter sp. ErkDOM-E TaxID=3402778 RepID=UPI003AF4DE72